MTAQADQTQASGQKEVLVLDPARSIIDRLGGAHAVAAMTGRHVTRVRRWTYPRERRGSDGIIPLPEALKIIENAADGKIGLTMDDFVVGANTITREDLRVLSFLLDGLSLKEIADATKDSQRRLRDVEQRLRANQRINPDVWGRIDRRRELRAADQK